MPTPVPPVPLFQLLTSLALIIAALYWAHAVPAPRWGAMVNRGDRLYLKQEDRTQAEEQVEQVSKERCWHDACRHDEKARVGIG